MSLNDYLYGEDDIDEDELQIKVEHVSLFAKLTPQHKDLIVHLLQQNNPRQTLQGWRSKEK